MKASFYFVLWIGIYFIFDIINVPFLQNNSFIAALIVIWMLQSFLNNALQNDIAKERQLSAIYLYEQIYTNDINSYRRKTLWNIIPYGVFTIYFLFTFIWILKFANYHDIGNTIFEMVIFGVLGGYYCWRTGKLIDEYVKLHRVYKLTDFFQGITANPAYMQFCEERTVRSFGEVLSTEPRPSSGYRIANIIFAIASILLGVWFLKVSLPHFFSSTQTGMYMVILVLYGALAIQAGIKDLMTSNR